jgi:glycosyltransferase involved in cell wall biosynthesis
MSPNRDVEKMRIAHVMSWYIPKLGYQENFLPAEQAKLGHEVHIITSDRVPNYKGYKDHVGRIVGKRIIGQGSFTENGVHIHRLSSSLELNDGGIVILRGLHRKIKEISPEIIHAHGAFIPLTAQVVFHNKKTGYGVLVDDHSHEDNFNIDSLAKKIYMHFIRIFYRYYGGRVCRWLPVTYSADRIIRDWLDIDESRIRILDLGSDSSLFHESSELRIAGRKELGVDDRSVLVVSAGKFDDSKDIHILIKAVESVRARHPEIVLLLVGGGPSQYMSKIRTMVSSSALLRDNVILKDFVPNDDLPKYYNSGDVGAWPGDHTITAIEAASTGLPCILPSNCAAYKVLLDFDAAIGFERGSIDSLVASLESLVDNSDLRIRMGRICADVVDSRLSWKRIAIESDSIYRTCNRSLGNSARKNLSAYPPGDGLIVTTSWDDGTISDLTLSTLLEEFSINGTFYVSNRQHYLERSLTLDEIRVLGKKHEIGAHTINHPRLDRLSIEEATREIVESKKYLEKCLDRQVDMFCYPFGKYSEDLAMVVMKNGFLGARTCLPSLSTSPIDPYNWRITLHASNGSPRSTLRIRRMSRLSFASIMDWERRAIELFDQAVKTGGVYHLWGHSSELEKLQEWDKLRRVFEHIAHRPGVRYLTNADCLRVLQ